MHIISNLGLFTTLKSYKPYLTEYDEEIQNVLQEANGIVNDKDPTDIYIYLVDMFISDVAIQRLSTSQLQILLLCQSYQLQH
jgi:hypothetical protein